MVSGSSSGTTTRVSGPSLGPAGPTRAQVGSSLGLSWAKLGPNWAHSGPKLEWSKRTGLIINLAHSAEGLDLIPGGFNNRRWPLTGPQPFLNGDPT